MSRYALAIVLFAACGEGQYCHESGSTYCYCDNNAQGLGGDPVTNECAAKSYSDGYCCADPSIKECECYDIKCITSATDCNCTNSSVFGGHTPMDDNCTATFAHCCYKGPGLCTCSDADCSGGAYEVSHCNDASIFTCNGGQKVDSCGKNGEAGVW